MRSVHFGGLWVLAIVCVGGLGGLVGAACAVPNIDEELPTDDSGPVDPVPDSSFSSSGSSGTTSSGGSTDAAPADTGPADTGVDAGPPLDGTYTGTYTNNRPFAGCNFTNAGDLTATFATTGADLTTTATVTGLEIRDIDSCDLLGKVGGSAPSSAVTSSAGSFTGNWKVNVNGGGQLDLPFTAKVTGKTVTGSWTCTSCTGTFTITKP